MRNQLLRLLAGVALAGLMAGCGPVETGDGTNKVSPAGVYTDATLIDHLQVAFDETKTCSALEAGEFEDLSVVMMEPRFPCPWYANGCSGEFVTPNTIKLGSPYVWKHEVLHYLLYVNTGRADPDHDSSLFWECV